MTIEPGPRPSWMYRQSAALPYRRIAGRLEVLLVTSRKQKRWIAPKGIVEQGLTPAESAAKEALEEAGVVGDLAEEAVGSYRHQKWHGVCDVEVFPLLVTAELETWDDAAVRERRWMAVEEAQRRVDNPQLARLIARLPDLVGTRNPH